MQPPPLPDNTAERPPVAERRAQRAVVRLIARQLQRTYTRLARRRPTAARGRRLQLWHRAVALLEESAGECFRPLSALLRAHPVLLQPLPPTGDTLLHVAVRQGTLAGVAALLALGFCPRQQNALGNDALRLALLFERRQVAEYLLRNYAALLDPAHFGLLPAASPAPPTASSAADSVQLEDKLEQLKLQQQQAAMVESDPSQQKAAPAICVTDTEPPTVAAPPSSRGTCELCGGHVARGWLCDDCLLPPDHESLIVAPLSAEAAVQRLSNAVPGDYFIRFDAHSPSMPYYLMVKASNGHDDDDGSDDETKAEAHDDAHNNGFVVVLPILLCKSAQNTTVCLELGSWPAEPHFCCIRRLLTYYYSHCVPYVNCPLNSPWGVAEPLLELQPCRGTCASKTNGFLAVPHLHRSKPSPVPEEREADFAQSMAAETSSICSESTGLGSSLDSTAN